MTTMEMPSAEWLAVIRDDYLRRYVPEGGAAVKFIVPADGQAGRDACIEQLRASAGCEGFAVATVDSRIVKIHLIDQLFFDVARQIDWTALTDGFLRRLLRAHGYQLPTEGELDAGRIAARNGIDPSEIFVQIERLLGDNLFHAYALSYEFRLAMTRLCQARLWPDTSAGPLAAPLGEWLRGELRTISVLKRARIYKKITRHTARHMLSSLAQWTRMAGMAGLMVALDIGRYTEGTRPAQPDGTFYYSNAATMDLYEVLRQFIDGADETRYCFLVVLAAPTFLTDERRGLQRYDALRLRISDEVHDRLRVNPLAALVRIGSGQ